jgi:ABC-type bacteriocin/lantibiotic exporter with double-glycine peptidase domain
MIFLKLIKQVKRTECGVACIAMLCGTSIEEARKLVGHTSDQKTGWTGTAEVRSALAKRHIKLGKEVWCDNWNKLESKTGVFLVAVNYKDICKVKGEEKRNWHWAIYDPAQADAPLLDPNSKGSKGRATGPTRLASYFHVYFQ